MAKLVGTVGMYHTALQVLVDDGYTVTCEFPTKDELDNRIRENDEVGYPLDYALPMEYYSAIKGDDVVVANDPLSLLGLIFLKEKVNDKKGYYDVAEGQQDNWAKLIHEGSLEPK